MEKIYRKYSYAILVGILILTCSQVLSYGYYHALEIDYEEFKPFNFLGNVFYGFYFFKTIGIILLLLGLVVFGGLLLKDSSKDIKNGNGVGFRPLSWNRKKKWIKGYTSRTKATKKKAYNRFLLRQVVNLHVVFLFWCMIQMGFEISVNNPLIQLSVISIFYSLYFINQYFLPELRDRLNHKAMRRNLKPILVAFFLLFYFYEVGNALGQMVKNQPYQKRYTPVSFYYETKKFSSDSTFTVLLKTNEILIMRDHLADSNYYYKWDKIIDYRTANKK